VAGSTVARVNLPFDILGKRVFSGTPKPGLFDPPIPVSDPQTAIWARFGKIGKAKRALFVPLFSETRANARKLVGT